MLGSYYLSARGVRSAPVELFAGGGRYGTI